MATFSKNLEEATEAELLWSINNEDFRVVHLASDELTRRYLNRLKDSIDTNTKELKQFAVNTSRFNADTSKQTEKMVSLTRTLTLLTWILVIGLIVQILLAVHYSHSCTGGRVNNEPWNYTCITEVGLGILGNYSFESHFTSKNPIP